MHCLALATTTLHTWESDFISANPYQLTPTVPVSLCIYIYIFHYICDLIYLYILYSKLIYIYMYIIHFSHQSHYCNSPNKKDTHFPLQHQSTTTSVPSSQRSVQGESCDLVTGSCSITFEDGAGWNPGDKSTAGNPQTMEVAEVDGRWCSLSIGGWISIQTVNLSEV